MIRSVEQIPEVAIYPLHIVQKAAQLSNILQLSHLLTKEFDVRNNNGLEKKVGLEKQTNQGYAIKTTATRETLHTINNMMLDRINDLTREGFRGLVEDIIEAHLKQWEKPQG
ncbi:MAG: hypothetical protein Q7S38_01910 [bacterium]|nr:hypothetical protein [bacterium]